MDQNAAAAPTTAVYGKEELQPFFHISQGQGGIFTLPFYNHDGVGIEHIGTHSCWTCVCIYVRLDEKRCFVAHIDGHTRSIYEDVEWIPENKQQRSSLKAHIADVFEKVLPDPYKNMTQAEKDEMKKSIVIVCPRMQLSHPDDGIPADASGGVIVQALREHFEIPPPDGPEKLAHGFVINHKTQEVTFLGWDQVVQPTAKLFLATDRAMNRAPDWRTDEEEELVKNHPLMLPPEAKGFFEVPGRTWTVVYDHDLLDWRQMRLPDFRPFIPLPHDHTQQARDEGEVRSRRDGKVILSSPAWQPVFAEDSPKKGPIRKSTKPSEETAQQGYSGTQILAAVNLAVSIATCLTISVRYWRA